MAMIKTRSRALVVTIKAISIIIAFKVSLIFLIVIASIMLAIQIEMVLKKCYSIKIQIKETM